jgi:catechol 2,3-dioxygenase-like lactoylglutathione lyase family enzyme
LERSVVFYRGRLGFEERRRLDDRFVLLGLGSFELGLVPVEKLEPGGRVYLWLYCDDVDAELEALRRAGVEVAREPEDMGSGELMASVRDPDGHEILLGQPAG